VSNAQVGILQSHKMDTLRSNCFLRSARARTAAKTHYFHLQPVDEFRFSSLCCTLTFEIMLVEAGLVCYQGEYDGGEDARAQS
jgi:hypothetical protein